MKTSSTEMAILQYVIVTLKMRKPKNWKKRVEIANKRISEIKKALKK